MTQKKDNLLQTVAKPVPGSFAVPAPAVVATVAAGPDSIFPAGIPIVVSAAFIPNPLATKAAPQKLDDAIEKRKDSSVCC